MVALAAVAVLCVFAVPAFAWTVEGLESGGVLITREAADSGPATWYVYRKVGTPSSTQYQDGSFDETGTANFFGSSGSAVQTFTLDAVTDVVAYRSVQGSSMLVVGDGGKHYFFAPDYYAKPVYLTAAMSGATYATYATNTPVTVLNPATSTVSVSGTLPVDVRSIAGDSALPVAALAVAGLSLGLMAFRGFLWKS